MNNNLFTNALEVEARIMERFERFCGKPSTELDPALRLLARWQASELAKRDKLISEERSRHNVLHLTERLLTAFAHVPRPACTVVQVVPADATAFSLNAVDGFHPIADSVHAWHLTPLCECSVTPAKLSYLVHKGEAFEVQTACSQRLVAEVETNDNDLWLGIQVPGGVLPDPIVLFVNGASKEGRYTWHELLRHAAWETASGQGFDVETGFPSGVATRDTILQPNHRLESELLHWSRGTYLQLRLSPRSAGPLSFLQPLFLQPLLAQAEASFEPFLWLRAKLPFKPVDTDAAFLQIGLNCIPVINRIQQEIQVEPVAGNRVIPLRIAGDRSEGFEGGAQFYSIERVEIEQVEVPSAAQRKQLQDTCFALEYGVLEKNKPPGYYVQLQCGEQPKSGRIVFWSTQINPEAEIPVGSGMEFSQPATLYHKGFGAQRGQPAYALTVLPVWGQQASPDEEQRRQLLRLSAWQGLTAAPSKEYLRARAFARLGEKLKAVSFMPGWLPEPFPARGARRVLTMLLVPNAALQGGVDWAMEAVLLQQTIADMPGFADGVIQVKIQA